MNKSIFLLLLCWLSISSLLASEVIVFSNPNKLLNIGKDVYLLQDKTNQLTIDDVINSKDFVKSDQEVPSLGTTTSSIWMKVEIQNTLLNQYLELKNPIIDEIDIFFLNDTGIISHTQTGCASSFDTREIKVNEYLFLLPKGTFTCYIRLFSNFPLQVPIHIASSNIFSEIRHVSDTAFAIYIGLMLIMIFYNFFLYISLKERTYLYYTMYVTLLTLTYLSFKGISFEYLWPNIPYCNFLIPSISSLTAIIFLLFLTDFLNLKEYYPNSIRFNYFFFIGFTVSIIINIYGNYNISVIVSQILTVLISIYVYVIGFLCYRKKIREARFFLLAWSLLLISTNIYILGINGIIMYNSFTNNSVLYGSAIETVLLSFALADRINILKREKLNALTANQQLIIDQNLILEKKVKVRTSEIERQNQVIEKQRVKEVNSLRFKALTGQMKPHFVFNSLNSIRCFVLNNEPLKADRFLIKFARLMRSMLDNSREDYCLLSDEVEALTNYLALEKLRFENKFDYTIQVDSAIDIDDVKIPSFLIQPYVENSVLHGVANKLGSTITIKFNLTAKGIVCVIEDNGVGRTSGEQPVKEYKSVGMSITKARLAAIGSNSGVKIIDLKDENGQPCGTRVEVQIDEK